MTKDLLMRAAGIECSGSVMPMEVHVSDGTPSKSLLRSDASAYAYAKSAMSSNPRPRICSTSMSGTRALDSKLRMASADVTCSSESAMLGPERRIGLRYWQSAKKIAGGRTQQAVCVKCVKPEELKSLHSAEVRACWPWQWSRHGLGGETATTAKNLLCPPAGQTLLCYGMSENACWHALCLHKCSWPK